MKKLLLSITCLLATTWTVAQENYPVDRSKYKDYTPIFAPDAALMNNVVIQKNKDNRHTRAAGSNGLPAYVNNANAKWFPPVFNQVGGSCGVSSRVGYMMTYEWNAFRLSDASKLENQLPPHFQYPFSYNNLGKEEMAMYVGYPTGDVYGGSDVSTIYGAYETNSNDAGWMQGYDSWYNAMFNRITRSANFPKGSQTPEGMEAIKRWLFNHNGDATWPTVTDANGTHIVGGVAGLGCGIARSQTAKVGNTAKNQAAGVVGKTYMKHWNTDYADHAITLVGYDDRVVFDLDGNGKYGETNNQLNQNEQGAWICVNSWGSGYGDNGQFYVPYPLAGGVSRAQTLVGADGQEITVYTGSGWWPEVYYLRQNYTPQQTMKVTMQYSKRSEISIKVGISQDLSSTIPEKERVFRYINYTGDGDDDPADAETPLLGRWADGKMHHEPMEFGIDLTDLCDGTDISRPLKFFLMVDSKNGATGEGVIKKVSIINYCLDENGVESPLSTQDVQIRNGGQRTIVSGIVRNESVNAPLNLTFDNHNNLSWDAPIQGFAQVAQYIIFQNGEKIAETINTRYKPSTSEGVFTVKALYNLDGKQKLSAASNSATLPQNKDDIYDPYVQQFTRSSGFIVPNVTSTSHQKFTIEYWLKPSSVSDYNQKIGKGWGTFWLHANNNRRLTFGWKADGINRTNSEPILEVGQWTHIALVIDGNTMTLYANGVKKGQFSSTAFSGMPATNDGLLFGAYNNDGLHGSIDDVRIWEVARSEQEVRNNYQTPIANPAGEKGLLAYFKMNTITQNGQTMLYDAAHGNHAQFIASDSHNTQQESGQTIRKQTLSTATIQGPQTANKGEVVSFTSTTSVGVIKKEWKASGAIPAQTTSNDASITFTSAGQQTVTLATTDVNGNIQQTTHLVNVLEVQPSADFTITDEHPKASERISFLAQNEAAGCIYSWQLPGTDITASNHRNVSAVFQKAGRYQVTLTVTSPNGKKYAQTKSITVAASVPKAIYKSSAKDNVVIKNEVVTFTDVSKYEPEEFSWSLMSHNQVYNGAEKKYTLKPQRAGIYKLYYTVSNAQGSDKLFKEQALIVCNADAQRGLNFSMVNGRSYKTLTTGTVSGINNEWTVDFWLKPTFVSSVSNGLYALNNDGTEVASLVVQPKGGATLKVGNQLFQITAPYFVPGQWHHYAITAGSTQIKLYRDGNLFSTFSLSNGNTASNVAKVRIGGEAQADGTYDEFRLWGKTLTLNDLRHYCVAPLSGTELANAVNNDMLKCYYQFNTIEDGANVPDQSGLGCNATRANFGPGGDAWVSSRGVFAIDFSPVEGEKIDEHTNLDRSAYRIVAISDEETQRERDGNGIAELAFDSDESSYWHSQYTGSEKGFPHSFTIDRANLDVINALKITNKRGSNYRATGVTVEQSDNMHQWEMMDNNHHFLDMETASIKLRKPVTKRYVRITFTESATQGSSLMTLHTINFYGTKDNSANLEKEIQLSYQGTSDENSNSRFKASNAVDGNINTQWRSQESSPYPHSIDVKNTSEGYSVETLNFVQAKIGNSQETRTHNAAHITIWVSANGQKWQEYEKIRLPYYSKTKVRLSKPIHLPYIRFQFTDSQMKGSGTFLALKEIQAYGRPSTETGIENVTQNTGLHNGRIYNLKGQCVGTSFSNLPAGVYIQNGKKIVKP